MVKLRSFSLTQNKKDLERVGQILNILVQFQIGGYVEKLIQAENLHIHISRRSASAEIKRMTQPERFARMFEELGTSFVKFGQILATREDIIGPDYAIELAKLHDDMKPFPTADARRIIKDELGKSVEQIFSKFEDKPMASASIAQVHRARLKNGKEVVVKIQRPGIEDTIKEDIRIMHYLAYLADKNIPELRPYSPQYLVDEFERSILKELDFSREAKNSARMKENFKGVKGIYIPIVYQEFSAKRVLTMEEIKGVKLTAFINSKANKEDKDIVARRLLRAYMQMILVDGFYHSDPHPGNIMILRGSTLCFLDFGRCASVDRELAANIFRLILFAVDNDVNGLIAHLLRTNLVEDNSDVKELKADLTDLLDADYDPDVKNIKIGEMLADMISIISKHDFNRPRALAELTRTLLILEGVGMQLDSKFNVSEEFGPYSQKYVAESLDPEKMTDLIKDGLLDFQYLARELPSTFRRLMKKISQGRITLQLEHKNLDTLTADMKDMTDRMSISMILAALIVGSSIIVHAMPSSVIGLALFAASAAIGVWLVLKTLVF